MVLNLDLNFPPMEEHLLAEGSSNSSNTRQGSVVIDVDVVAPIPIDVEASDDDVQLLSSMPSVPQGWNRSRRNQPMVVQQAAEVPPGQSGFIVEDPITTLSLNSLNSHGRIVGDEKVVDCELFSSLEGHHAIEQNQNVPSSSQTAAALSPSPPPPPPPPKEFVFNCPVCMSELIAPCSTKCGHIFCQTCITMSIQKRKQCPTCRKKVTARSFHRVYLPSAD